jgi:hypothetical protein
MTDAPELTFDRLEIDMVYAERGWLIEEDAVLTYCRLIGAPVRTQGFNDKGQPRMLAPPTMLMMFTPPRSCFNHWTVPVGGIHTNQEWVTHAPVAVGDEVKLRVKVAEKFEHKLRRFVIFEMRYTSELGSGPVKLLASARLGLIL